MPWLAGGAILAGAPAATAAEASAKNPPIARVLEQFQNTPEYARRVAKLPAPSPFSKEAKFSDGSKVTLKLKTTAPATLGITKNPVGKPKKESSDGWDCTTTVVNITADSSSFLNNAYSGQVANIYPGACYTYEHLTDGSWQEQTGARNPITISTDNPNVKGLSYVTVANPSVATIESAVAQIYSRFDATTANESTAYQVCEQENSATYNLQIGATASGYGLSFSDVYGTGNQSSHVYLTVDATKTLFSITTAPPTNDFFVDPNVEATPNLTYLGEVDYGVRILANVDLTFASEQAANNFKGSYSGFGASLSLSEKNGSASKSTAATINSYVIGGPGNTIVAYSLADLKAQINKVFAGATYKNARPIRYYACSMAGAVVYNASATDSFPEQNCVPSGNSANEIDNVMVTFTQGNDGKEAPSTYYAYLYPGMTAVANGAEPQPMYICRDQGGEKYNNNGTAQIFLTRNKEYKGKFEEGAFMKEGGVLVVGGLHYPGGVSGIGYDLWDINGVSLQINLKTSATDPNSQAPISIGNPNDRNGQTWNPGSGPNQVVLDSRTGNVAMFLFDKSFTAQGLGSQ